MDNNFEIEVEVAEALLDEGVWIPIKEFRLPFRKQALRMRVKLKRPCLGGQIRIARLYLKIGVRVEQLKSFDKEEQMRFMSEHGKTVSRIIALTICRGLITGYLFTRIIAWLLRWFVENIYLEASFEKFVVLMGTHSFENIIGSVQKMNPLAPLNPSQQTKKRS
jgi:hypothetical protein